MLQAIGKYAAIRPDSPEETTKSGIIIPSSAVPSKPTQVGTIASIDAAYVSSMGYPFEEGDRVYYALYAPVEIEEGGVTYAFVEVSDILAVLKDN